MSTWTLPGRPDILLMFTVDDALGIVDRPLLPGEREQMVKQLELAFGEVYEDALLAVTDAAVLGDERASSLREGDVFREYGLEEWVVVDALGHHGDTVLVTSPEGDEYSFDIDEVVERWNNNPNTSEEDTA